MTTRKYAAKAIPASYPVGQRGGAARAAREYLDWLDSLPEIDEPHNWGDDEYPEGYELGIDWDFVPGEDRKNDR